MARAQVADMSAWPSLSLEGNLIAPVMVARIDRREAPEQDEDDYGVRKGLTIRDEVSLAFRVGQAHFDRFAKIEAPSADATRRFARDFLDETFGFDDITDGSDAISCIAGGRVPVVVVPPSETLDRRSPTLSVDRSRSPTIALQDYLNEREEALWGLVTNGTHLRLLRDNASLTRPAHIEADLAQIFANEDAASFAALWLLIHRSRFGAAGAPSTDCALERWRDTGAREGEAARDRLAGQVEVALRVLGSGFLEANPDLARQLRSGELALTPWFNELLRLVYRLIFLMVAEDRNLLHPSNARAGARKLYAEGYGLTALRTQSVRRAAWDRHHDRYEGMKIVFRALAAGEEALGLPALGGLFAPDRLPSLDSARLPNQAFMEAIYRLAWLSDRSNMVPVNWRAMETEELGSVYESLLELQPQLADDGRELVFASSVSEQKGNQRRTTASYYTPDSLVQALLDTALDPILDRTEAGAEDPAEALLGLTVLDPACGSGHFLLAAARRIATRLARIRAEGTPSLADYRHALRDTVRNCVHGVDRNPMAVELTQVALWIETVDPGLPLGFLDAQIRCGDALLGLLDLSVLEQGIPDAAYKPITGDDKTVARHYARKNKTEKSERVHVEEGLQFGRQRDLVRDISAMRAMPEETLNQIGAKSARLKELTQDGTDSWALARACDLYVAAFLTPKIVPTTTAGPDGLPRRGTETVATSGTLWEFLRGREPFGPLTKTVADLASYYRFFHWPIAFADVMARGGFDLVLGNPPWETMSPDQKEFFSVYEPEVRFMAPADQKAAFDHLLEHSQIAARWEQYCRDLYAAVHFMKSSGRYCLFAPGNLGKGDFNVYRMFVETAFAATRGGGTAAQFVPEGFYKGANAAAIRSAVFNKFELSFLIGFLNSRGTWFPSIHLQFEFCLYVAVKRGNTRDVFAAFRVTSHEKLAEVISGAKLRIPVSLIKEFSPSAKAVMEFAAQEEIDICTRMYARYPKFGAKIDGLPHRHYMREVDMGNDRALFSEGDDGLPVFEGRMVDAYDYRAKGYVSGRGRSAVWKDLVFGSASKQIQPQWRILSEDIPDKLDSRIDRYRVGFCDVVNPATEKCLLATLIPPQTVCGHSVPTIIFEGGSAHDLLLWIGVANSLVMDFVVRKKVRLHMTYTVLDSLPFPRDFEQTPSSLEIARRVCLLCAFGPEMSDFREQAVDEGILAVGDNVIHDADRRALLAAETNVLVAREVYGLTKQEVLYILDPVNILGEDCGIETFKVLRNREMREFGEYRTQKLISDAWDRIKARGEL